MKFRITCTAYWVSDKDYKKLSKLGINFVKETEPYYLRHGEWRRDNYQENSSYIEISSIDELLKIIEKHGDIVLSKDTIEIYNDYRE